MNAPSLADCFSQSYADARAAFLRACADARAEITSYRHPLSAPDGAPLLCTRPAACHRGGSGHNASIRVAIAPSDAMVGSRTRKLGGTGDRPRRYRAR